MTAETINRTNALLNKRLGASSGIFDPRIMSNDEKSRSLWNSESVELAKKGMLEGYKLKESPFIKTVRDAQLRRANLPFKYTEDEMSVLEMCMEDKLIFGNNFIKLKDGDEGWQKITLRKYQEDLLEKYALNNWNILMFPRQSGKTTTTVVEIVHFCTFNFDKDCVVIAQSDMVVNEILKKIKEAFNSLPFFMQPGFVSFNARGFTLDNGCRLSIGIASESVVQGFALDFLFIDEFAYIPNSKVDKFWNNVYPTLVNNPNSRCIIASTPNGRNKFYELWTGAEAKDNQFITSRIYWYEVPDKGSKTGFRDEEFKRKTIANVGIVGWEMGFECSFDTQLKSIFNTKIQKDLRHKQTIAKECWAQSNNPIGETFNISFRAQNFMSELPDGTKIQTGIQYDLKQDYFIVGIDIAEGLGQDSSVLKIRKLDWDREKKRIIYRNIGVFRDKDISVEDFADMTLNLLEHFNLSRTRVVVETNNYGGEFFKHIDNKVLYEKEYHWFDQVVFAKFMRASKDDYERGIRWDKYNKKTAVKSFTNLISTETFDETHWQSVEEYLNFGKSPNDTYKAQYGHDDLVAVDLSMSQFVRSGNMYSRDFLTEAESTLRRNCMDLAQDVIDAEEKLRKEQENVHRMPGGWYQRNHAQAWNARHGSKSKNGYVL
jgi:hypothetical protein